MTDETKPCDLLVTGDLILTLDAASSTLKSVAPARMSPEGGDS